MMIGASLLYKDSMKKHELPWNHEDLVRDLALKEIFNTMSSSDEFIYSVVEKVILNPVRDKETILYRQGVLKDAIKNKEVLRDIYEIVNKAIADARKSIFWFSIREDPYLMAEKSIAALKVLIPALKRIREIAEGNLQSFSSEGFKRVFSTISKQFNDSYISEVMDTLKSLRFDEEVNACVNIGDGNVFVNYRLQAPTEKKGFLDSLRVRKQRYVYTIPPRDEAGGQILAEMKNKALKKASKVLNKSLENVIEFFNMLKEELAFYIGCANLYERLNAIEVPITFPRPLDEEAIEFQDLYNTTLLLMIGKGVVPNSLKANQKELFIITGANRGGKTTFIRSVGQAQLLMQSGCFVPARSFSSPIFYNIFTHFTREEDISGKVGKLEEELARMKKIVDNAKGKSMVIMNESFSSTNSYEGSEIARQVVSAFIKKGFFVFYVTHLYEFSSWAYNSLESVVFLKAERKEGGKRTYRIVEGVPEETAYAKDIYSKIFNVT
ncbi:MAG: hypothetical protein G5Z42_03325 [Caldisphaeraceae archaeon]|nr:hypothetical protein [Caldisphaeraceae archaeon]